MNKITLMYFLSFGLLAIMFLIPNIAPARTYIFINNTSTEKVLTYSYPIPEIPEEEPGTIREITAYNAGDPTQTDDTPCIGASNKDICVLLEQGQKVCASNAYPFYTKINIEGYGDCIILDRMNKRYKNRIDIAMTKEQKAEAYNWGLKKLKVRVLED